MRGRDDETGIDWLYSIKFVTNFLQLYMKICRTPLSILEMAWDITPIAVKSKSMGQRKGFGCFPDPFVEAYLVV